MAAGRREVDITASDIARFLGLPLVGEDLVVRGPSPAGAPKPETLVFIKEGATALVQTANAVGGLLTLLRPEMADESSTAHIATDNPRLAFAKVVRAFFLEEPSANVATTARISESAVVGDGVSIGEYSVIGDGVVIGDRTRIGNHVSIIGQATIGQDCSIKTHAVIGEEGFGFEFDEEGNPIRLPHLGSVILGNHVDVGSFTTVLRGTIGSTILRDWVKIDDHVHIAHNVVIGERSFVIANAEVSGSVKVGADVWIAPQASTMNGIVIGEGAMIGLGAVVTKNVEPRTVVAGNPARVIRTREPESSPERRI